MEFQSLEQNSPSSGAYELGYGYTTFDFAGKHTRDFCTEVLRFKSDCFRVQALYEVTGEIRCTQCWGGVGNSSEAAQLK